MHRYPSQLAHPQRQVVAIVGDGGFGMPTTPQEWHARLTAHTASYDPTSPPDVRARTSIELRTLPFF